MAERPTLAGLAGQLRGDVEKKKVVKVQSEAELLDSVGEYLGHLEHIFHSNTLDAAELRLWLDSSALMLGKDLSKERLGTPEAQSIAIGIENLTDIERDITECNEALRDSAEIAEVSVEALLADQSNELVQRIVALRLEKTEEVRALRAALQAYGLGLVRIMQDGNEKKKAMTHGELAEWQKKFASPEAMPTEYPSFVVKVQQDFIAKQLRETEVRSQYSYELSEFTERDVAVGEYVWGTYAKFVADTLNTELPGPENEEKRKSLLTRILNSGGVDAISHFDSSSGRISVDTVLRESLSQPGLIDILRQTVMARCLMRMRLPGRRIIDIADNFAVKDFQSAYPDCIDLLEGIADPASWRDGLNHPGETPQFIIRAKGEGLGKIGPNQKRAQKEVAFANRVDAVVKFLYNGLSNNRKSEMSGGPIRGYEVFSPVRKALYGLNETIPAIPLERSSDDIFYSPLSVPAESRVTMEQATRDARAFEQGLANALNKGKLSHDWVAESPSDVAMRNASRIAAAEQQALSATGGERKAAEVERALGLAKEKIAALEEKLRAATDTATEMTTQLEQRNRELVTAKAATVKSEGEKANLIEKKTTLEGEKAAAEERAAAAEGKTNSILELLRVPAENPEMLGGNLKKVVAKILEDSKQKSKK